MASCNAETRSCKDEEERKSSSERHGPLSKVNVIDCNYTDKTSLMRNASLDGDMNVDPSTNNSLGSDVTELQCDLKSNCSQTKKGKKRKKRPQIKQNGQIDRQGDGSSIKDDSIGTNSCNERGVDTNMKTDLQKLPKLSRSQKKRMRKKQKLNATVISNKAHGPCGELDLVKGGENAEKPSDSPRNPSTDLKKKHDDDGKPGLVESVVDINKKAAPCSELSRSQKKRMRKKQKLNATVINNKARGSLAELDLVKVRENDEKLSDSPRNPSTDLNKKHDNDDKHGLVETIVDINKRAAPFSELSRSQKKRTRKKQKLNANVINNEAYGSFAELDSIKVGENAEKLSGSSRNPSADLKKKHYNDGKPGLVESVVDINKKAAPFSELSQSQKKRMRKKQKLKATVINNKAHGSLAELDSVKVGENDEKLSDSPRNPSTDLNKKHDNDGKPGLVESIVDINKLNPTVINNKAHGSLAELDSIKVGENAEKLIGSSRNPSADFKKKHYNDGKPGLVESIVDINKKEGPLSELSRSQKKRMRKKQNLNATMINNKVHGAIAELDSIKVGEDAEKLSDLPRNPNADLKKKHDNDGKPGLVESVVDIDKKAAPLSELSRSLKKRMREKQKLNATGINNKAHGSLAELDLTKVGESALISENRNDSPRSPTASLVKKHDNNGGTGLGLVEKENIKTNQLKGKLRTYRRKKRQSPDYEENAEPIMVARQTSTNSHKVHSFEPSKNEIERVQPKENDTSIKIVENVLREKTSSNCSNGGFACVESKNVTGTEKDVDLDVSVKQGNLPKVSFPSLEGPLVGCADKKLLILDINGLLADFVPYCSNAYTADVIISRKSVFKRPFCDDFLQFCFDKFNVGVWSSRTKKNLDKAIDFLMKDSRHKLLFCWHQSHCTKTGFTTVENKSKPLVLKELRKLWDKLEPGLPWNKGDYNESNTLLLDDSPYKALRNPAHTAVFPHSYQYKDTGDSSLGPGGDLRVYLERLAEARNVQEYVAQNPFGQRAITESNPSWGFYQKILSADLYQ